MDSGVACEAYSISTHFFFVCVCVCVPDTGAYLQAYGCNLITLSFMLHSRAYRQAPMLTCNLWGIQYWHQEPNNTSLAACDRCNYGCQSEKQNLSRST